jgi:hypothetical protein
MVSKAMQARLRANREGRLHRQQYLDLIAQPLVIGLLLFVPAVFIIGARLTYLVVSRTWRLAMIAFIVYLALRMVIQAVRFTRAQIQFAILRGTPHITAPWRPQPLETEGGDLLRFQTRLAPPLRIQADERYLVYYLKDGDRLVLLSLAPVNHPRAEQWYPAQSPT